MGDVQGKRKKKKYGKIYKSAEDEAIHKAIYLKNMREIEKHNIHYKKGERPYWKEENEFTDLTEDEIRQYYRSIRVTLLDEKYFIKHIKPHCSNNHLNGNRK
ncbi:crustapain-like isoform X2 [Culicoides brevitarsis]|uniref:crustapain-like isoform X2 n=1 Tax=Culicoides brevitarsis TaxID=469753 RepID=UPI00307B7BD3